MPITYTWSLTADEGVGPQADSPRVSSALLAPIDIELDNEGDILIERGDLQLTKGTQAIAQRLKIRLQFFRGEWFLDDKPGVPWFQSILKKQVSPLSVATIFREEILATPGVSDVQVTLARFDTAARLYSLSFSAVADTGALLRGEGRADVSGAEA